MRSSDLLAGLDLLERLLSAGLTVEADRERCRIWVSPASRLTPEISDRVRDRKEALIGVLDPASPDGPCSDCGSPDFVRVAAGTWRCLRCAELTDPARAVAWYFGPTRWTNGGTAP